MRPEPYHLKSHFPLTPGKGRSRRSSSKSTSSGITESAPLLLLTLVLILAPVSALQGQWTKSTLFDDSDMALDLGEAGSFKKYPTYQQYLDMMQAFAWDYPDICRLDTIGYSNEGRLLLALKISDRVQQDEAEASFLYTSTMHGNEILGYVLLLQLADSLLEAYGAEAEITRLVDNLQIWINPLANPDGAFSGGNDLTLQYATRSNARGVDLNRDFPRALYGEADDSTGRELETGNMMEFHRKHGFILSANIHSGVEVVNYPWDDRQALHVDDEWYRFISREYADEAMAVDPDYMWGWPDDGITNGWAWYQALGTRQDYVNYYLGGREVTLELTEEFLLPSAELDRYWNINRRSLINYMSQCLHGIRGQVSDTDSGEPLQAQIFVREHDSSYSVVRSSPDHGDYYRLIKEGIYDLLVSAPGYHSDTIHAVAVTDYQATRVDIQLKAYELGLHEFQEPMFLIYPNPAHHEFSVELKNLAHGEMELTIFSLDGKLVRRELRYYQGSAIELSTSQMEEGIYLVRCSCGGHSRVLRLVVLKP